MGTLTTRASFRFYVEEAINVFGTEHLSNLAEIDP